MIARAYREIEESDAALLLEELASQATLSPWQFPGCSNRPSA